MPWRRVTFLRGETLIPELTTVGRSQQRQAVGGHLRPHCHPDAYEVVLITQGKVRWWVEAQTVELEAGELFLTRPGEMHGAIDDALEPCEIYWVQFRLVAAERPLGMDEQEVAAMRAALDSCARWGRAPPGLARHFDRLLGEHVRTPGRPRLVAARALCLLDESVDALAAGSRTVTTDPRLATAAAFMHDNLERPIKVADLAGLAGLSANRFATLFREAYGLPPADYVNRERVAAARRLLQSADDSIADIAMKYGFSSSQYFATVFKRYSGVTPSQYRRRSNGSKSPVVSAQARVEPTWGDAART